MSFLPGVTYNTSAIYRLRLLRHHGQRPTAVLRMPRDATHSNVWQPIAPETTTAMQWCCAKDVHDELTVSRIWRLLLYIAERYFWCIYQLSCLCRTAEGVPRELCCLIALLTLEQGTKGFHDNLERNNFLSMFPAGHVLFANISDYFTKVSNYVEIVQVIYTAHRSRGPVPVVGG